MPPIHGHRGWQQASCACHVHSSVASREVAQRCEAAPVRLGQRPWLKGIPNRDDAMVLGHGWGRQRPAQSSAQCVIIKPASTQASLPAAVRSLPLVHVPMTHRGDPRPLHISSSCSESCLTQTCQLLLHSCVQEAGSSRHEYWCQQQSKQKHSNGGRTVPTPCMYAARRCTDFCVLQILLSLMSFERPSATALASLPLKA